MANIGKVSQVIGPAVDVEFAEGKQPQIYTAIEITSRGFTVYAIPMASRSARTLSKCCRASGDSESRMEGAFSMMG